MFFTPVFACAQINKLTPSVGIKVSTTSLDGFPTSSGDDFTMKYPVRLGLAVKLTDRYFLDIGTEEYIDFNNLLTSLQWSFYYAYNSERTLHLMRSVRPGSRSYVGLGYNNERRGIRASDRYTNEMEHGAFLAYRVFFGSNFFEFRSKFRIHPDFEALVDPGYYQIVVGRNLLQSHNDTLRGHNDLSLKPMFGLRTVYSNIKKTRPDTYPKHFSTFPYAAVLVSYKDFPLGLYAGIDTWLDLNHNLSSEKLYNHYMGSREIGVMYSRKRLSAGLTYCVFHDQDVYAYILDNPDVYPQDEPSKTFREQAAVRSIALTADYQVYSNFHLNVRHAVVVKSLYPDFSPRYSSFGLSYWLN